MSWQARVLNRWLRLTEKTFLARTTDPKRLRRAFENKARFFFHPPLGTKLSWVELAGGRALKVTPRGGSKGPTILYYHGGAHVFGSPRTHSAMIASLAKHAGAVALLPELPLAPEAPFPAALDHAVAAYHACLATGVDPSRLIIGGDSAGGGLVLALLGRLVADGAPLPAGLFAFSPLTDLRFSGPSFTLNAQDDVVLPAELAPEMAAMYLAGHSPDDPGVTPLNADFTGAGPVWLAVGDTEILLDDSVRMEKRMASQNVSVSLTVEADLPHVWPLFHNVLPEAGATLRALAIWIKDHANASAATR